MKKLFVSFLCVIMVMVFVPTMAFAVENDYYFEVTKNGVTDKFATAGEAVDSVAAGETATIKLLSDYSGGGVIVGNGNKTNMNITFDLNGYSWKIGNPLVGSTGTETNAFQLLRDNTVTFKNGEITSDKAYILIQNYANLTIDGVDLSLTTPGTGYYAASNNNGSTVIKGGSTITVNEGNYAMDSFNFSSYSGGNVTVEDAYIIGDVEIANGGQLKLDGGIIEGDVIVYNYSNKGDAHEDDTSNFSMEDGMITGDVKTSEKGNTVVNGGLVDGTVSLDSSKGAKAAVSGGIFTKVDENVTISGNVSVDFTVEGETVTVIGELYVETMLETMEDMLTPEELALVTMNVAKAPKGYEMSVPAGITVVNNTGNEIVVNDDTVAADEQIVVKEPEADKPGTDTPGTDKPGTDTPVTDTPDTDKETPDTDKGNTGAGKPEETKNGTPKTADASNLLPWIVMMAVAAGAAAVFKKKENQ